MNRPLTQEDLRDKGMPFSCDNCGMKPTAESVVKNHGNCEACGDSIICYSIDAAEMIIKLSKGTP